MWIFFVGETADPIIPRGKSGGFIPEFYFIVVWYGTIGKSACKKVVHNDGPAVRFGGPAVRFGGPGAVGFVDLRTSVYPPVRPAKIFGGLRRVE